MKVFKGYMLLMSILLLSGSIAFGQAKKTTISADLSQCKFKKAGLYKTGKETTMVSQAEIDTAGKFRMVMDIANTDVYKLQFEDGLYISIILEPGNNIFITGNMEDLMNTVNLAGSEQSMLIYESDKVLRSYKARLDSINAAYYQGMSKGISDSVVQVLTNLYRATEKSQNEYMVQFVKDHPATMACLFFVDRLSIDDYFTTYELLDKNLFEKYPENMYIQNFHTRVGNAKKLAIGGEAPEIALPDPDGNIIKLSSLRGKVVLIDFWASWCNPCRKESPNMVKIFNANKDKGFTILSVSLDKTKDAWVKAIKDDGLTWNHVSDLKFWQCEAALLYNVTAVPYTVLLDKDGKIVAKNLRGEELSKKVAEMVGR